MTPLFAWFNPFHNHQEARTLAEDHFIKRLSVINDLKLVLSLVKHTVTDHNPYKFEEGRTVHRNSVSLIFENWLKRRQTVSSILLFMFWAGKRAEDLEVEGPSNFR